MTVPTMVARNTSPSFSCENALSSIDTRSVKMVWLVPLFHPSQRVMWAYLFPSATTET